ncbi:MAG: hypothetical protein WCX90_10320 [Thiohalomonadaceae bacterium]|nr:hypothetical protein [Porticoccaceae bacterium]
MNSLAQDYPAILSDSHESPCLSLYQPTHRQHPDNAQDSIRFRNLVKMMEESLRQKYPKREIKSLLQPFEALAENRAFWNHTTVGLAILSAPGMFRVYRLPRPVAELVVVADSFHTKPLMRIAQSADHYHVLALSRSSFKIYAGNRDSLNEMLPIEGVPQTAAELLGIEADEREGAHRAYGHGPAGGAARHGTDVKQDAISRDTDNFFRSVDQAVLQHCSQPSGMRLILAALPEHHHRFRSISHNPFLMKEAIDVHPDDLSLDALRERAWQLVQPYYLERLAGFVDAYGKAAANGQGSDELDELAKAAIAGRIATLLIEADRLIPGSINVTNGTITAGDLDHPEVDDVLDDLGEHVLKNGGEVVIVPAERMPTKSGAAAIYRF